MTDRQNFKEFAALIARILGVEDAKVTRDARFADELEADSIDLLEVVAALETEYEVTFDEERVYDIVTVGEAFDLLQSAEAAEQE